MTVPPEPPAAVRRGAMTAPGLRDRAERSAARRGGLGLAATAVSVVLTVTVAALGPSIMEPALPGGSGQPPWALAAHPSPYLAVTLTGAAILAGVAGLIFSGNALRHGWRCPAGLILAAGIIAAIVLAVLPPFGSADHLSYAAYGRMAVTGHDPYTTTPAALARLGDPVARAVQDWRGSASVYGSLAVAGQALAARVGAGSVRLTVFVLSLLNVAAFVLTGLMLHVLGRGDAGRQLRAAILWTANPLLLMVLVAGAHVDSQAVLFGVAAVAVAVTGLRPARAFGRARRDALVAAGVGALVGLGFAIKVTTALVGMGLGIAIVFAWSADRRGQPVPGGSREVPAARVSRAPVRWLAAVLGGLAGGFCVVVSASLLPWGAGVFGPALHAGSYTSIGSPWRLVRSGLHLVLSENAAETVVKAGALALAACLLILLLRYFRDTTDQLLVGCAFAVVFAWLMAWPYVLPWYDGLGWALLALLPASRLDWLLLARTAALAVGYLPARVHVVVPSGLRWLESVVRTAVTPAVLLAVTVLAIAWLWAPRRQALAVAQ
ncbi:MAG TPA: polyprenol phosphomannose-dependent alpha 1,6 mannosyltransferase MptB [Streptosporangiaceae bacterium]|nr:polyprenol phosphomannose-dependent alpha 1,6 mannosyltransferase MptB [Streptosporangiaceae bacterium]